MSANRLAPLRPGIAVRAEDALDLISVDYEPLRTVVDVREAIKPSSAVLFDELGTNLAWHGLAQLR